MKFWSDYENGGANMVNYKEFDVSEMADVIAIYENVG